MTDDELTAAVDACTEKSTRGLGMFEQFTKLVFTLLNEMRTLETRVNTHGHDINGLEKDIFHLKEIAEENKETYKKVSESLVLINTSLCPILKKNRKLDKIWSHMGWIGAGSVIFTAVVLIVLLVSDPETLINFIAKIK